jgi:prefoldin subunit 5
LKQKVPELESSLSLVKSLIKKQEESVTDGAVRYALADNVYAKAEVDFTGGTVCLWLGANVMLEYTYEEALEFLNKNLERAKTEYTNTKNDLSFVRDQIVTSQVNISRIYNWDVRRKRAAAAAK